MGELTLTEDQITDLVTKVAAQAAEGAVKAINTVNPGERPEATKGAPAFHRSRSAFPSLMTAIKATRTGRWDQAGYERDVVSTAKALWYNDPKDDLAPNSVVWPKNYQEALEVFEAMGEKESIKAADRLDQAIKAMNESLTVNVTGGTGGGLLVPPDFQQDMFEYALAPRVALRRVPGVTVLRVNAPDVRFPREDTRAGASQAAEAGTLSSADSALTTQAIRIEKQYAMRRFSSELLADARPSFQTYIDRTVVRDLAIQQDIQYLRGSGSTPQITGILNYSGLTTGPSMGTNGRTPTWDDLMDAVYNLEAVDSTQPNFVIGHPRPFHTLRKVKDAQGRYLVTDAGIVPGQAGPDVVLMGWLPAYKTTNLTITQTVGTSTDCTTLIVGDASTVFILERAGMEFAMSEHLYFTTDEIAVRAIARSAVAIMQPASVELITGVRA